MNYIGTTFVSNSYAPSINRFSNLAYEETTYYMFYGNDGYVITAIHRHYLDNQRDIMIVYLRDVDNFELLNPPCKTCLVYPTCLKIRPDKTINGLYVNLQVCQEMLDFALKKHIEVMKRRESGKDATMYDLR